MIWTVAKREILSNIITFRFLAGLILCLGLITASAFVLTRDYEVRLKSYDQNISWHEITKDVKVYSQLQFSAYRPPSPLSFLCIGSDKKLGNTVSDVSYREVPREAIGQGGGNQLMSVFPPLDMAIIIQAVLGLLALLLSYDAISGERERGTLAMMVSNPVPRHSILLGKLLGGMISVALPLVVGMLAGLLVVLISGSVVFDSSVWLRIGLVFTCTLLYLLAIFMLGILVSARTRRSATSLVILLFIWVVLVMLLPNVAPHIARHLRGVGDKATVETKREALQSEFQDKIYQFGMAQRQAGKFHSGWFKFSVGGWQYSGDVPYPRAIKYGAREQIVWFQEGIKYCVPLHMEYANRIWNLYRAYDAELRSQVALSENISRISPAWTYYRTASILAGTDYNTYTRFLSQARQYRQKLIDYTDAQKGFSTLPFFTTMKMDETLTVAQLTEVEADQGWKAIRKLQARYWGNAPVLRDIPEFRYQPESITESIDRALPDLLILSLLNVVLFLAAYASFIRQEVK